MISACPRCWRPLPDLVERCPEHDLKPVVDRNGQLVAGRYLIGKLIGLGTELTTVWHAQDTHRLRSVALKLCPPEAPAELERTRHGVAVSASFDHDHITRVHEYGFTPRGAFYCVMERLRGRTLQRLLEDHPLTLPDALGLGDQILAGLEHIHAAHVLHRDVKPANVFLDHSRRGPWRVKLLDFGIACDLATASRGEPDGRIVGTPEYMAPEQVLAGPLDPRTDLYQFGVVLYRMLTGRLPFLVATRRENYQAHLDAPVPRMREVAPERHIPLSAERLMRHLLAKDPARRPPNATAVRQTLREIAAEHAARLPETEASSVSSVLARPGDDAA